MAKWVVCFGTTMEDLLNEYKEDFEGMDYPKICDELTNQAEAYLKRKFRNVVPLEDKRNGEIFSVRFGIDTRQKPSIHKLSVPYMELLELQPYSEVYDE